MRRLAADREREQRLRKEKRQLVKQARVRVVVCQCVPVRVCDCLIGLIDVHTIQYNTVGECGAPTA